MARVPLYRSLYAQVLAGITLGIIVGLVAPETGAAMRPLGDGFIRLIRMLIGPIVFTTIVVGLAHVGEMREVGRIGLRAFIYFEVVSTLALIIGLVVVTVLQPGVGWHVTPSPADVKAAAGYGAAASEPHGTIPPAALALLVGVDRFMSEVRAITNLIGNAVATVAIARWDNALDFGRAQALLRAPAGSEDPAATIDVQGASSSG
jgi:Na+/H+-dicarboxylate symporter